MNTVQKEEAYYVIDCPGYVLYFAKQIAGAPINIVLSKAS